MIQKKILLLAGAALLLSGCGKESYREIHVEKTQGTVCVERGTDKLDAYEKMQLKNDDAMQTEKKSQSDLKLDEDKFLLVGEDTRLKLLADGKKNDARTTIVLEYGRITNRIAEKLTDTESYEIETPNAVLAIRGTTFSVNAFSLPDGTAYTDLTVYEGAVETMIRGEENPVMTDAGMTTRIWSKDGESNYTQDPSDYAGLMDTEITFLKDQQILDADMEKKLSVGKNDGFIPYLREYYNADGKLSKFDSYQYEFSQPGVIRKRIITESYPQRLGHTKSYTEYDEYGTVIFSQSSPEGSETYIEWHEPRYENGVLVEDRCTDELGSVFTKTYEYGDGTLLSYTETSEHQLDQITYAYDEDGRMKQQARVTTKRNGQTKRFHIHDYSYGPDGYLSSKTYLQYTEDNGSRTESTQDDDTYEYSPEKNWRKETTVSEKGSMTITYEVKKNELFRYQEADCPWEIEAQPAVTPVGEIEMPEMTPPAAPVEDETESQPETEPETTAPVPSGDYLNYALDYNKIHIEGMNDGDVDYSGTYTDGGSYYEVSGSVVYYEHPLRYVDMQDSYAGDRVATKFRFTKDAVILSDGMEYPVKEFLDAYNGHFPNALFVDSYDANGYITYAGWHDAG